MLFKSVIFSNEFTIVSSLSVNIIFQKGEEKRHYFEDVIFGFPSASVLFFVLPHFFIQSPFRFVLYSEREAVKGSKPLLMAVDK